MNQLLLVTGIALSLGLSASANIIPTNTTTTGTGPFVWTYDFQLSSDQNINAGGAPLINPVAHTNVNFAGFLTLYDFGGYLSGSCAGPVGWTCTAQNIGFTPDDVVPADNPNLVNITWAYTSGPTILGQPGGVDLGLFSAVSVYSTPARVSYAARGIKNLGGQAGTISDNVGNTNAPFSSVPEPAPLTSIATGLGLIGCVSVIRRLRDQA